MNHESTDVHFQARVLAGQAIAEKETMNKLWEAACYSRGKHRMALAKALAQAEVVYWKVARAALSYLPEKEQPRYDI